MSTNDYSQLRTLLSNFCRNELNHGRCTEECCEVCCVNETYDKTRSSETLDKVEKSLYSNINNKHKQQHIY